MLDHVIFTEKNNCQDCYRCIKECPVKSIKMEGHTASVLFDSCIYCGQCVLVCPSKAKRYREEVDLVRRWIDSGEKVVACLAPSFATDFDDLTNEEFVKNLYQLGFSAVSETAIGADIVAVKTNEWLATQGNGVYISSCCPAVVNYIHLYEPESIPHLVPIVSPMVAHARLLRKSCYPAEKLVFIGPCIAKKDEKDYNEDCLDAVITFQELKAWFDDEGLGDLDYSKVTIPNDFIIGRAGQGGIFPVDGGMLTTMQNNIGVTENEYMSFSGMAHVIDICKEVKTWKAKEGKVFLELMACTGGCIKGPAMINPDGVVAKRKQMIEKHGITLKSNLPYKPLKYEECDWMNDTFNRGYILECTYSEEEITQVLQSMGKWSEKDELNCNGCGYDTCRSLAKAILSGKAHREMCVSCMRKEAQDKASILLQKMPYGVVIVDENLKILDSNRKFAEMMGEEVMDIFETIHGLKGVDVSKILPFYHLFSAVLSSAGENVVEHDIREENNFFHLSLISLQKYKSVCGILQNLREPEVQRELMISRVQEVIKQNAESVQRIAYLLGENASFTESMLNSIVDSHETESKN